MTLVKYLTVFNALCSFLKNVISDDQIVNQIAPKTKPSRRSFRVNNQMHFFIRVTHQPKGKPGDSCTVLIGDIGAKNNLFIIQKIPKLLIVQISFQIPGIILRLHSIL